MSHMVGGCPRKNLSRGLWLSDEMMVEVTTQKVGKVDQAGY